MRIAGVVLAVLGGLAVLLGVAGYVATSVRFASITCPGDTSCLDRLMGHGIYGSLGIAGLLVAAVGGVFVLVAARGRALKARRRRWLTGE